MPAAGSNSARPSLWRGECQFIASSDNRATFPPEGAPEISFMGRSNVGKSSLINAVTRQKKLARKGATPGLTRSLLFFELTGGVRLVDCPGYGYTGAKPAKAEAMQRVVPDYLSFRKNIRLVCLLIDSRRGIMPSDKPFLAILAKKQHLFVIILTKTDKLSEKQNQQALDSVKDVMKDYPGALTPEIIPTSALKNKGIDYLRQFIDEICYKESNLSEKNE